MIVRGLVLFLYLLLWPSLAGAQGFAGMGSADQAFARPDPAVRFSFPQDHGPHPEFRIEWWYLTATLTGDDGKTYGIQWTLFRNALSPGLSVEDPRQVWMGHAGLTTETDHFAAERFARGGSGLAGVEAIPFNAFIDEWEMRGPDLSDINLFAQGSDFSYDLKLHSTAPFVPQGKSGFSIKSEAGNASHYYSQPFYGVSGTLSLPDGDVAVTGLGWLDREWSSDPLTETQTGWDWISLHFEDGSKLMGYRLRDEDGSAYTVGTRISATGIPQPLEDGALRMTKVAETRVEGAMVPTAWRVELNQENLDVTVSAVNPQSWMDVSIPYWEGPVKVEGTHAGRGYLEMTGYEN